MHHNLIQKHVCIISDLLAKLNRCELMYIKKDVHFKAIEGALRLNHWILILKRQA